MRIVASFGLAAFGLAVLGLAADLPPLRLKAGGRPPSASVAPASLSWERNAVSPERWIVQYGAEPGEAEAQRVEAAGGRVLSRIPEQAWLVTLPAGATAQWEGVVYAGRLRAENKWSPLLDKDKRTELSVVVDLHADGDPATARGEAYRSGLRVEERPGLPAHRLLVRGSKARLREFADLSEVAYLYPAPEALVMGLPMEACAHGPSMLTSSFGDGWDGPGRGGAEIGVWFGAAYSGLPEDWTKEELQRALLQWSSVASLAFREVASADLERTIDIVFAARDHGDGYPFDGPGKALAHTFYPPPSEEPLAGDLHFDNEEAWKIGADPDIYSVALHELGHSLGLAHLDDPKSVMYPFYQRTERLTQADVDSVLLLYAAVPSEPPTLPPPLPPQPPVTPPPPETPVTPPPAKPPVTEPPPADPQTPSPTDRTPPTLRITDPSQAAVSTTNSEIVIRGTAMDNVAIGEVNWESTSESKGRITKAAQFELPPIKLFVGTNRIVVRAVDTSGNTAMRAVTVTRR